MSLADHLARPHLWPLLFAVPVVAALLVGGRRARRRRLEATVGVRTARLLAQARTRARRQERWLWVGASTAAVVALLGPFGAAGSSAVERIGIDVVLALDVSRSMAARDVTPDRLGRARKEILALAADPAGHRLALVAFAGEARLLVPLTRDGATVARRVATADAASVAVGGTDLAAVLRAAGQALAARSARRAAVVLLSDGEDLGAGAIEAARALAEAGIVVHAIGLGTTEGAKIPDPAGSGFVRDGAGDEVVSRLSGDALRELVEATGGTWRRATPDGAGEELLALRREVLDPAASLEAVAEGAVRRGDGYQVPLLLALLLALLAFAFVERRNA